LFHLKVNLAELNKEVDSLRKEANILTKKVSEQNLIIKGLIRSLKVKMNTEQKQTGAINSNQSTVTSSSSGMSSCSNEASSGSFNLTSSQVKTFVFKYNLALKDFR